MKMDLEDIQKMSNYLCFRFDPTKMMITLTTVPDSARSLLFTTQKNGGKSFDLQYVLYYHFTTAPQRVKFSY